MAAALAFGPFRTLEGKKKAFGAFRAFPGCQTARLERKKKSFCLPWPSRQKTLAVLGSVVCSLAVASLAIVAFGRGCWKSLRPWAPKACEVWGRQWKGVSLGWPCGNGCGIGVWAVSWKVWKARKKHLARFGRFRAAKRQVLNSRQKLLPSLALKTRNCCPPWPSGLLTGNGGFGHG